MSENNNNEYSWLDNPSIVTSVIIGIISFIIILSQSFAVNHGVTSFDILKNVINHNIIYLLILVYFVALKTTVGKKYFNYLNLFLVILYFITSLTSLLTIFQSFLLTSLVNSLLNIFIFLYLFHIFFRRTRIWKDFELDKSPFNEVTNDAYFYVITILSIVLLLVKLIFTSSFNGTMLLTLDTIYIIMFSRYVYLYGVFLDKKEKKVVDSINLSEIKDKALEVIGDIKEKVEEFDIDDKKNKSTKKKSPKRGDK